MRFVVTGDVEIGKSTALRRLARQMRRKGFQLGGVLTATDRRGRKWVTDLATGKRRLLATREPGGGLTVGRYTLRQEAIDFANAAIESGGHADLLIVDELGSLELKSSGFMAAFDAVSQRGKQPVLLVVRQKLVDQYAAQIGPFDLIFTVTAENRDAIDRDIFKALTAI